MKIYKILTVILCIASAILFYTLYRSIQGTIEEREKIEQQEAAIIDRLKLIREAEICYNSVFGKYTASWDTLSNFVQNGKVPILQRREQITIKPYGGEEVKVIIDTLGSIPAFEKIFKKQYTFNAPDNGIFKRFRVKLGDKVFKNQRAMDMISGEGKLISVPFTEQGTISALAKINEGDSLKKGQELIRFWDYTFNPNVDVSKIGEVPGHLGERFDIAVSRVNRNGVKVQVIEVKDPKPDNPKRSEANEQKNLKPLRFGSTTDVSTSGNWE